MTVAETLLISLMMQLGQLIGRCSLAGEEECARRERLPRIGTQPVVQHHDVQHIQQLALVLVHALDLAVEDRLRIHRDPVGGLQPLRERKLGLAFRRAELAAELRVVHEQQQFAQPLQVRHPVAADGCDR